MPNEHLPEIGSTVTIEKPAFNLLLSRLKDEGYQSIGPRIKNDSLVYEQIESLDDLPQGYSTEQKPGYFRLIREKHNRYFASSPAHIRGNNSCSPHGIELFSLHKHGKSWENTTGQPEIPSYAFIGVRACELPADSGIRDCFKGRHTG